MVEVQDEAADGIYFTMCVFRYFLDLITVVTFHQVFYLESDLKWDRT